MSVQIKIDLPDSSLSIFKTTPEDLGKEMRLAAAVKWYEIGKISQSKAAELSGVSRIEFLKALSKFDVSPFQITVEELGKEVENA